MCDIPHYEDLALIAMAGPMLTVTVKRDMKQNCFVSTSAYFTVEANDCVAMHLH